MIVVTCCFDYYNIQWFLLEVACIMNLYIFYNKNYQTNLILNPQSKPSKSPRYTHKTHLNRSGQFKVIVRLTHVAQKMKDIMLTICSDVQFLNPTRGDVQMFLSIKSSLLLAQVHADQLPSMEGLSCQQMLPAGQVTEVVVDRAETSVAVLQVYLYE